MFLHPEGGMPAFGRLPEEGMMEEPKSRVMTPGDYQVDTDGSKPEHRAEVEMSLGWEHQRA